MEVGGCQGAGQLGEEGGGEGALGGAGGGGAGAGQGTPGCSPGQGGAGQARLAIKYEDFCLLKVVLSFEMHINAYS